MAVRVREKRIIAELGGPAELHSRLTRYTERVSVLASKRRELTKKYPKQWVAMYQEEVACVADTLEKLLQEVDKKNLPRDEIAIQFLDTEKRILVL